MLARLEAHLARFGTFRAAETELGVPRSTAYRWAKKHGLKHRTRALTPEKKRRLVRLLAKGKNGGWVVARKVGVSRKTAWRYMQLSAIAGLQDLSKRANIPLPCAPWRCPAGGELLKLTICVVHRTRKPVGSVKRKPFGTGKRRRRHV